MKGNKIIIILIMSNILTISTIYNFIRKDYLNNEKIILKSMIETEYEEYITSLNQSHSDYVKYIQESKEQIASAITDMGVSTSEDVGPETMANNIRSIARDASSISYDNTSSGIISTTVQGAVDEIDSKIDNINVNSSQGIIKKMYEFTVTVGANSRLVHNINHEKPNGYEIGAITPLIGSAEYINVQVNYYDDTQISLGINSHKTDAALTRTGYIIVLYIKSN